MPANVSLIGLLPYSPELNPVENLWHYLRAHHWSNRVYADYDALLEAATEAWRKVCLDPEKIRSICAAPYLESADNSSDPYKIGATPGRSPTVGRSGSASIGGMVGRYFDATRDPSP